MPRKIPLMRMRLWLEEYEKGRPEASIAKDAHCDVRTIKRGIELARREREVGIARAELLKEALRKHNYSLIGKLDEILSQIGVPPVDSIVLPWSGRKKIETMAVVGEWGIEVSEDVSHDARFAAEDSAEWELLREHLKRDPLWKLLSGWQRAYTAHRNAKIGFQAKALDLLEENTGYRVVDDKDAVNPPFIYIYNAPDLLFKEAIRRVLGIDDGTKLENRIVVDSATGDVRYDRAAILAVAPGEEEDCKKNMLAALNELEKSSEAARVASTYRVLKESTDKARKAVEDISLLGLVPGQCRICRRLGM